MKIQTAPTSAQRFEPNSFYERLIAMRGTDRKTFDSFSIPTKLALAEYEKQRRQHELNQLNQAAHESA